MTLQCVTSFPQTTEEAIREEILDERKDEGWYFSKRNQTLWVLRSELLPPKRLYKEEFEGEN